MVGERREPGDDLALQPEGGDSVGDPFFCLRYDLEDRPAQMLDRFGSATAARDESTSALDMYPIVGRRPIGVKRAAGLPASDRWVPDGPSAVVPTHPPLTPEGQIADMGRCAEGLRRIVTNWRLRRQPAPPPSWDPLTRTEPVVSVAPSACCGGGRAPPVPEGRRHWSDPTCSPASSTGCPEGSPPTPGPSPPAGVPPMATAGPGRGGHRSGPRDPGSTPGSSRSTSPRRSPTC